MNTYRSKKISTKFKGEKTFQQITHSPSTAKPGDCLTVKMPRIKDLPVVPGTIAISFDMDIVLDPAEPGTAVNTYPVNNLAANLFSRIVVKVGSKAIYELNNAHLYNTYKDLWLSEKQRANSIFRGIQDEELRKLRSDLKTTLSLSKNSNTKLKNIFGKRYTVPLNFELVSDHTPLYTWGIDDDIVFDLTINSKEYVLKYSKADTANFTLNNICLEYVTLRNDELKNDIVRELDVGCPFLFDDVHHYVCRKIDKKETIVNEEVKTDRKSLKGILIIFQDELTAGERDSEQFPNPEIVNVKFTIGNPNQLYNTGYKTYHQWDEIFKHFVSEDFKKSHDIYMDMIKYYSDNKFALWIDFSTTEDNNLHGTGKEQGANQPIMFEITKKSKGEGHYMMHIFIVSDARIIIKNRMFGDVEK